MKEQDLSEQLKAFLDFVDIRYKNAGTRDKIVDEFLEFYVDLNDVNHIMTGDGMNSLEFFDMIKREWCVSEEQWKPFWNDVLTFARKYHKERKEYGG